MTLQGSFPISANNINVELGRSGSAAFSMDNESERMLADRQSGSYSFSDFLGKTGVKTLVTTGLSARSTSHSFSGLDLGLDLGSTSNTGIVWLIFGMDKNSGDTGSFAVSNGAVSGGTTGGAYFTQWHQAGSSSNILTMVGRFRTQSPGGTRTLSFNTDSPCRCRAVGILVLGGDGTWSAAQADSDSAGSSGCTATFDVQTNGIPIVGAIKAIDNGLSISGITNRGELSSLSQYRMAWGFNNKQSAQGGRNFSFTTVAASAVIGLSMNPGAAG